MVNGSVKKKLTLRERIRGTDRRAGLIPSKGWVGRNYQYFSSSLLPALMRKRERSPFTDSDSDFRPLAEGETEIIWIGHASFLVRTANFNALIDPVWANWMGPIKRSRAPGIPIEKLPDIDLVMITHAHFDHLCRKTLKRIANASHNHLQTILVPHGVSSVLKKIPFSEVKEMDDWDEFEFRGTKITFTPAQHWGARFFHDMHRGFGGYMLETGDHNLFHSGDSAYFDGFVDIGKRFNIDTAILPIGAYDCPSGREVHMNPEEAVLAFKDLKANRMIPMHHATFAISIEKMCEPIRRLNAEAELKSISDQVITPHEGEPIRLNGSED
ncbi:MAG: MBL fold metallo-hydrolase [Verrucomicrobiales bacterium]